MKLDYRHHINEYGEHMVRLYDFKKEEAIKFRDAVQQHLLIDKEILDLNSLDFIEASKCHLTLRLHQEELGISTSNGKQFYCDLTTAGYENMIKLLTPFTQRECSTFQLLYDVDSLIDFIFSPTGSQ